MGELIGTLADVRKVTFGTERFWVSFSEKDFLGISDQNCFWLNILESKVTWKDSNNRDLGQISWS